MPAAEYAKKVVKQVLGSRLPAWYWIGSLRPSGLPCVRRIFSGEEGSEGSESDVRQFTLVTFGE